jgi:hypothetical protein
VAVLACLGYWLVARRGFGAIARLTLLTALLNTALKEAFRVPRPPGPQLVEESGWSFPSGHAQLAAALAVWLSLGARRPRAALGWGGLALLIAASRVALGVHTLVDVAVGAALGAASAAALWRAGRGAAARGWRRMGLSGQALLLLALALAVLALPGGDRPALPGLAALLLSFHVSDALRERWLARPGSAAGGPPAHASATRRLLGVAVCLPALYALVAVLERLQTGLVRPGGALLLLGAAGGVVGLGVPALLRGLGLAPDADAA